MVVVIFISIIHDFFVPVISVVDNYKFNIKWKSNNLRKIFNKSIKTKINLEKIPVYKKYKKGLGDNESI
jgi:hypothetical protein